MSEETQQSLTKQDRRPTLLIDFDGVIHSYENGWQGGEIYGTVVPGFFEWCHRVADHFKLAVYSSRSGDVATRLAMEAWIMQQQQAFRLECQTERMVFFEFPIIKPAAWLTIDDRCIRFTGDWECLELRLAWLLAFQPWNMPAKATL